MFHFRADSGAIRLMQETRRRMKRLGHSTCKREKYPSPMQQSSAAYEFMPKSSDNLSQDDLEGPKYLCFLTGSKGVERAKRESGARNVINP